MRKMYTKFFGKQILCYETIDSTQKEIWRRVNQNNIKNGTVVIAKTQTSGIGTHGRIWHTDVDKNIAFSIFIKTNCKMKNLQGLTVDIAKTLVEVFKNLYNVKLYIKYPNDIVYKNKKIGGILTETKIQEEKVKCIVIGIGINTNQEIFVGELQNIATSIKKEFKISVENNLVINRFCELFETELIDRKIYDL